MRIELGSEVKDKTTGFTGVASSRTEYLTGCVRYGVQSRKLGKDGLPGDYIMFDEDSLEVVKAKKAKKKPVKGGNLSHNPQLSRKSISK